MKMLGPNSTEPNDDDNDAITGDEIETTNSQFIAMKRFVSEACGHPNSLK